MGMFILVSFFFISCQSLPKPSNSNEALLVIDATFEYKGTSREPFRYYNLYIADSNDIIKILPSSKLIIVNYLQPGDYKINRVESIHMEENRPRIEEVDISFTLEPGQITILDHRFKMWIQPEEKDGSNYYQYWSLEKLIRPEIEELQSKIQDMNYFEMWRGIK
jgi:hypothetical protein